MDKSEPIPYPIPELFSYAEASKIVGLKEITLRRKAAAGLIPHYKVGGKNVRFSMNHLRTLFREVPARVAK